MDSEDSCSLQKQAQSSMECCQKSTSLNLPSDEEVQRTRASSGATSCLSELKEQLSSGEQHKTCSYNFYQSSECCSSSSDHSDSSPEDKIAVAASRQDQNKNNSAQNDHAAINKNNCSDSNKSKIANDMNDDSNSSSNNCSSDSDDKSLTRKLEAETFVPSTPYIHKFRTMLCKTWKEGKVCQFGDRCSFAHGEHMLNTNPVAAPAKTK